ncbi:DsbA family protein [Streptomyces sp. NBC_01498]|uniref:DsbA family protein n=1 Tax=Streptomyces sp. NBC_01498 TaxID=2975870 RepID=UPI002E7B14C3|nr:DsbA family protein [Streptomyces sp. NBC_01498]WTL27346.1 DsbA family protein [Streptomyces sp. NBC_01498]
MSARNSSTNKAAARERLREERERQAKKDRTRRQLVVAGSTVAILAIAGGVGFGVAQANKPSHWEAAKDAKTVTAPKHTSGENGTTVVIGKPEAKKTLELYEDSRCPICATFEQQVGGTIQKDVDAGKYKIQYVGATFIDNSDNGEGSKNALSALGAALDVSPEAFSAYKTALYSERNHPAESEDKFADDGVLLKIADSVDGLKGNAAFEKNVKDGTFDAWAMKMSATFDSSSVQGTPTLRMDGRTVTGAGSENAPLTAAEFTQAITKALAG